MPSRNWLDLLFPRSCSDCGEASSDLLCPSCETAIPWLETTEAVAGASGPLDGILAPVAFTDPVRGWILAFKYPPRGLFGQSASATGLVLWLARQGGERLEARARIHALERRVQLADGRHHLHTPRPPSPSPPPAEIDELRTSVEQGAGSSVAFENKLRELTERREDLSRERDSAAQTVLQVRNEIAGLSVTVGYCR